MTALMAGGNQVFQEELNEARVQAQREDNERAWQEWRRMLSQEQTAQVEAFLLANLDRIRLQPWTVWNMINQAQQDQTATDARAIGQRDGQDCRQGQTGPSDINKIIRKDGGK
jgi:hypothetical protein